MALSFPALFQKVAASQEFATAIFRGHIHLTVDGKGRILDIMSPWQFSDHSMVLELKRAGTIAKHFDVPPESVAALKRPGDFRVFENKFYFETSDVPETFYTAFSTWSLFLCKISDRLFYGVIRTGNVIPNFFPQRANGILFIDDRERLVGFNHAFFRFFSKKFKSPDALLNRPARGFLDPSPWEIQRLRIEKALSGGRPLALRLRRRFEGDKSAAGFTLSHPGSFTPGGRGLRMENATFNLVFLTLPVDIDTRKDFLLELEFTHHKGSLPLAVLGEPWGREEVLDGHGYLFGPHPNEPRFFIKRKGITQRLGAPLPAPGKMIYTLRKAGNALVFRVNGRETLSYYDFNFLHQRTGRLSLALRMGSGCLVERVSLDVGGPAADDPMDLPLTRLHVPEGNAFVINPLDSVSLAGRHAGIAAFMLENAAEMQQRLTSLKVEHDRVLEISGLAAERFLGTSAALTALRDKALRAAESEATVLIAGETGTGKEELAQFIHGHGHRADRPFVKVDCSLLPSTLVESELFGHERGAFTGAESRRIGYFERAQGGTLFLDEVGNLSPDVQAKLLQFLEARTITRVGGSEPIRLDVRVLAAANVPLADLVDRGAFRRDLFFRLNVVALTLPPLRERKEDIPALCRHFLKNINARHGWSVGEPSHKAYQKLFDHAWPGNVRELRNVLEQAVVFCGGKAIGPEHLQFTPLSNRAPGRKRHPLKGVGPDALARLFENHGGVAAKVARALNVSARALYLRIRKQGLSLDALRARPSA